MGLFTSKIAIGVLAGGFTLAGAGLLFTGSETLQNASSFVQQAGNKITQFEVNENSLLDKIATLKSDANSKIEVANAKIAEKKVKIGELEGQISSLTSEKEALMAEVASLESEITGLQAELNTANANLASTQAALDEKTAQYDAKVAELNKANKTIAELNNLLVWAKNKAVEADKHVTELEGELQQANTEVATHGEVVEQVKTETEGAEPLTQEEVDAVETDTIDVDSE